MAGFSSGKNVKENINLTEAQTLSNKTMDSTNTISGAPINNSTVTGASLVSPTRADVKKDTQANLETYAASATDGQLVFATDTQTMYQIKNNALAEVGGGAGGINYISNPDFNINADGYTGDTNFTVSRTTSSPIRGDGSGLLSKAAVDASGEEISIPFTVANGDLAQKLTISFEYDASDANYADDDIRVLVRKDPNGTPELLRINGEDLKAGKGTHYAQFQTDASIAEYELVLQVNSANASAYAVKIDSVSVGPTNLAFGTIVTDWEEGTVSSPPSNTSMAKVLYRRVGDTADIQLGIDINSNTNISSTPRNSIIPDGLELDISKLSSSGASQTYIAVGTWAGHDPGVSTNSGVVFYRADNDSFTFVADNVAVSFDAGDNVGALIKLPIQGWSANTKMSEDLGGREVVVRAAGNGGESITANVTDIPFTEVEDTTASWDGSVFTAPESGHYAVEGSLVFTSTAVRGVDTYIDGVIDKRVSDSISAGSHHFSVNLYLNKGDVLSFRAAGSGGTLSNQSQYHHLHIQKLASPQTILETETVAARYTSDSGQSVGTSASTFIYENLYKDTHNAYNTSTGEYTVPVSGWYNLNSAVRVVYSPGSDSNTVVVQIDVDGNTVVDAIERVGSTVNTGYQCRVSDNLYLEKGQVVTINAASTANSTAVTNGSQSFFSIARIK